MLFGYSANFPGFNKLPLDDILINEMTGETYLTIWVFTKALTVAFIISRSSLPIFASSITLSRTDIAPFSIPLIAASLIKPRYSLGTFAFRRIVSNCSFILFSISSETDRFLIGSAGLVLFSLIFELRDYCCRHFSTGLS